MTEEKTLISSMRFILRSCFLSAEASFATAGCLQPLFRIAVLTVSVFMLSACMDKTESFSPFSVPVPDNYKQIDSPDGVPIPIPAIPAKTISSPLDQAPVVLDSMLIDWWRLLGNAELNVYIDRAIANNPQLQIAAHRVMQSKAREIQGNAERLPELSLPISYEAESPSGGIGSVDAGQDAKVKREYQLSLRTDWRVDLWGEKRAQAEAGDMALRQVIFLYDDQLRRLIMDVALTYVEYLSLNDRIRLANESEESLSAMLDAMEQRLQQGDATIVDVKLQHAAVYGIRATVPTLMLRREQLRSRLSVLVGAGPAALELSDAGLDDIAFPSVLPDVPAMLLLRRPDIRAVEAQLLSAEADVHVARARLYPELDLSAQIGYGSRHLSDWFEPHRLFWNLVTELSASIFDGGKRQQEIEFNQSVRAELVENYVRVVYLALQQVDDALLDISLAAQRVELQTNATESAQQAKSLSFESYQAGGVDYLTMLDATRTYQQQADDLFSFRMEQYQAYVDLFAALGGGAPDRDALYVREQPKDGALVSIIDNDSSASEQQDGLGWLVTRQQRQGQGSWLVQLSGIHDRVGVEASWRDLKHRYPLQTEGRYLLVKQLPFSSDIGLKDVAWYQLLVEDFATQAKAEQWCDELKRQQQRCSVIEDPDRWQVDAVFAWGEGDLYSQIFQHRYMGRKAIGDIDQQLETGSPEAFSKQQLKQKTLFKLDMLD